MERAPPAVSCSARALLCSGCFLFGVRQKLTLGDGKIKKVLQINGLGLQAFVLLSPFVVWGLREGLSNSTSLYW